MNFVAIDFETATYARDSACAVGLVKVVGGEIVDKAVHLIKPPTREFVFTYQGNRISEHGEEFDEIFLIPRGFFEFCA